MVGPAEEKVYQASCSHLHIRDELAPKDGVIFKGPKCDIPMILSPKIKEKFHRSHIESISFQLQPDNPTKVVLGDKRVSIKWEFTPDAGETVPTVLFKRKKPDDVSPSQIASRTPTGSFDMNKNFVDYRNYEAKLNSELVILDVNKHQDYIYTLRIIYQDSNGFQIKDYQVLVEVMGK
ncbi:hypothetical protein OS493_038447 [Desmophyllum pertusum]|uniref:Uncharacterized protein n=1 Tax=Desmophyllum pertusum TaxID=174260 RepID=A0A9W9ZHP5_9CNID|nr:hypothetical protein OS493_038447 [Desmophyllum pertusum]